MAASAAEALATQLFDSPKASKTTSSVHFETQVPRYIPTCDQKWSVVAALDRVMDQLRHLPEAASQDSDEVTLNPKP